MKRLYLHFDDDISMFVFFKQDVVEWCLINGSYNQYSYRPFEVKEITNSYIKFDEQCLVKDNNKIILKLNDENIKLHLILTPYTPVDNIDFTGNCNTSGIINFDNNILKVNGNCYYTVETNDTIIQLDNGIFITITNNELTTPSLIGLTKTVKPTITTNKEYKDITTGLNIQLNQIYKTDDMELFLKINNINQVFTETDKPYWCGVVDVVYNQNVNGKGFYYKPYQQTTIENLLKIVNETINETYDRIIYNEPNNFFKQVLPEYYLDCLSIETLTPLKKKLMENNYPVRAYIFYICCKMITDEEINLDILLYPELCNLEYTFITDLYGKMFNLEHLINYNVEQTISFQTLYKHIIKGNLNDLKQKIINNYLLSKGFLLGQIGTLSNNDETGYITKYLENLATAVQIMYDVKDATNLLKKKIVPYPLVVSMIKMTKTEQIKLWKNISDVDYVLKRINFKETVAIVNQMVDVSNVKLEETYRDSYYRKLLINLSKYLVK